jgi:hypothetical protein
MDWRTLPTLILEAIAAAREEQGGVDRGWWSSTLAARKLALVSPPPSAPALPPRVYSHPGVEQVVTSRYYRIIGFHWYTSRGQEGGLEL